MAVNEEHDNDISEMLGLMGKVAKKGISKINPVNILKNFIEKINPVRNKQKRLTKSNSKLEKKIDKVVDKRELIKQNTELKARNVELKLELKKQKDILKEIKLITKEKNPNKEVVAQKMEEVLKKFENPLKEPVNETQKINTKKEEVKKDKVKENEPKSINNINKESKVVELNDKGFEFTGTNKDLLLFKKLNKTSIDYKELSVMIKDKDFLSKVVYNLLEARSEKLITTDNLDLKKTKFSITEKGLETAEKYDKKVVTEIDEIKAKREQIQKKNIKTKQKLDKGNKKNDVKGNQVKDKTSIKSKVAAR